MGFCHKSQERICSEKGEDISIIKNRERGSSGVCEGPVKKEVYLTIKITIDITSVLYTEEEWEEEDGILLSISKQLDN